LRDFFRLLSWQPVSISDKGSNLLVLGPVKVGDKVKFVATKLDGALVVTGLQIRR
jgi:Cu/Ag efflux protein CusF